MYDFLIILWICIGSIMGIILLYSGIKYLNTLFYRNKLKKQYNINFIPSSFKIKKNKKGYDGVYELKYPEWLYSNKNGSRNRVRKNNKLVYYPCNLYYREFEITTKNPIDIPKQESFFSVSERMEKSISDIANTNKGKTVCIVSHGIAIQSYMFKLYKKEFKELQQLKNTEYIEFEL